MKITTKHPTSNYGIPVILDAKGETMGYADGVKTVRAQLSLTTSDLAEKCGVSRRSVEGWEQGRHVPAAALNVMRDLIA